MHRWGLPPATMVRIMRYMIWKPWRIAHSFDAWNPMVTTTSTFVTRHFPFMGVSESELFCRYAIVAARFFGNPKKWPVNPRLPESGRNGFLQLMKTFPSLRITILR